MMNFLARIIAACGLLVLTVPVAAEVVHAAHIEAELIAENTALKPGADNQVALRLKPDAGWHTYWVNSGDAGYATTLQWHLPPGFSAGPVVWPHPEKHSLGELTTYGYETETLHRVAVTVPAQAASPAPLAVTAKWLVCSAEICIPGEAALTLTLPLGDAPAPDPRWVAAFAEARARTPQGTHSLKAVFSLDGKQLLLEVQGLSATDAARAEFFPAASDLVNHSARQHVSFNDRAVRFTQQLSDYLPAPAPQTVAGVLVVNDGDDGTAYSIAAVPGVLTNTAPSTAAPAAQSLLLILGLALLGGLILNLMPCVFPVLSLKALAVMQARDVNHAHVHHALSYTAGVVLSCVAVAGVLLALRAGGAAIGWGFQFQAPVFVAALAYLMFALGLAMSGAVELGSGLAGIGQSLTQKTGLAGSFFTGVLATVVASPCTAPFMGTALGYAVTQPDGVALLVFATLGLGLALPFLLLGFFPVLAGLLPRPGAWMLTFKQFMAFPLYLTAVWLLWVTANQVGADGALLIGVGLVLIAFALWLWPRKGTGGRLLRYGALAAALALLAHPLLRGEHTTEPATNAWSEARVAELRAQGHTIFVNFTADWCLTCKVNERVALSTVRVQQAFKERRVVYLVADWTNPDPAISNALTQFGRPGVPMYLVYVNGGEPKLLPQVLTPEIVISALEN